MNLDENDVLAKEVDNKQVLIANDLSLLAHEENKIRWLNIIKGIFNLLIGSIFTYCVFMIGLYAIYKANDHGMHGSSDPSLLSTLVVYCITGIFAVLTLWKGFGTMQQKVEITEEHKAEILSLPGEPNYERAKIKRFNHYFLWGSGILFVASQTSSVGEYLDSKFAPYLTAFLLFVFTFAFINNKRHQSK